jgi:hypothetical protein
MRHLSFELLSYTLRVSLMTTGSTSSDAGSNVIAQISAFGLLLVEVVALLLLLRTGSW